ncbi:Cytochrome P450 [Mycena sanguinolenta]|uniref:Cytochrome P450 n=1 Tax=Mycena sanguinolenta TaxID=230812 RepID=A0A8H6ZEF6_9AGAR|nr:Cytochrome P450 [Mycena sanguinolenta]
MDSLSTFSALALSIALLPVLYRKLTSKNPAPFPPGPKGLPILGNALDMPTSHPWITFSQWGEKYGGLVYLNALGKSLVIINDANYAVDILDKKARSSSDRPTLVMAGQLVGWDKLPALAQTSHPSPWPEVRRLFAQSMGSRRKAEEFGDIFEVETRAFLKRTVENPMQWLEHTKRFASAIVVKVAYGYTPRDENDELLMLANEAMDQFSEMTAVNAFAVDSIPILRFVPSWFPGAGWKTKVDVYRRSLQRMTDRPYEWTMQAMRDGSDVRGVVADQIAGTTQLTPDEETVIKMTAAGIYSGGADTSVAAIECFVLAMTLHIPEQTKAQEELDAVLGAGVLPTLADRDRLPYFNALFTEVLRRYTLIFLGLPHVTDQDDIHAGYFIPKGTILLANNWAFFNDPNIYPEPKVFSPDRFLVSPSGRTAQKDPRDFLFGYGRRVCPGIHFADASIWLVCISLLATCTVRPVDVNGVTAPPLAQFTDGAISHPLPFETNITPRSVLNK